MINITDFDSFQIEVTNLDDEVEYKKLKNFCNRSALKEEVLNKEINFKKRSALVEIKNSFRGLFLFHLIFEEFHPWILIRGIKKLFKADFPKEILQVNFLPKNWSSKVEGKIKAVVK